MNNLFGMEDYKRKYQTTIASGVVILIASLILFGVSIWGLVRTHTTSPDVSLAPFIAMIVVDTLVAILGIHCLRRGLIYANVKKHGYPATCKVVDKVFNHIRRGYRCRLIVLYQGESGTKYELSLPMFLEDADRAKVGDKVNCLILGEECYVDPFNIEISKVFGNIDE